MRFSFLVRADNGERCIGTYSWDPVVELEYPEAFQNALVKLDLKKTFRYVYLGGAFTETDQERKLWFLAGARHVRVCCSHTQNSTRPTWY